MDSLFAAVKIHKRRAQKMRSYYAIKERQENQKRERDEFERENQFFSSRIQKLEEIVCELQKSIQEKDEELCLAQEKVWVLQEEVWRLQKVVMDKEKCVAELRELIEYLHSFIENPSESNDEVPDSAVDREQTLQGLRKKLQGWFRDWLSYLFRDAKAFKKAFGVTIDDYNDLYRDIQRMLKETTVHSDARLRSTTQQTFSDQEELLLTLFWMRHGLTLELLASLTGLVPSTIQRVTYRILCVLDSLFEVEIHWPSDAEFRAHQEDVRPQKKHPFN